MITFSSLLSSLPQKEVVEGTSQTIPNHEKEASVSHESFAVDSTIQQNPPPFRSASPVMTYAPIIGSCLLPTSKVPCGDAERSGEEKPTPWMGGVTEERMFDTSFGSPTSKNLAEDGRSRAAACSLWLWDNLRELRKCKNLIYSCMEEKVVRETRQECQELGSLVSTKHFFFFTVLLDCRALSNLT